MRIVGRYDHLSDVIFSQRQQPISDCEICNFVGGNMPRVDRDVRVVHHVTHELETCRMSGVLTLDHKALQVMRYE